jgi:hypothetical protein
MPSREIIARRRPPNAATGLAPDFRVHNARIGGNGRRAPTAETHSDRTRDPAHAYKASVDEFSGLDHALWVAVRI